VGGVISRAAKQSPQTLFRKLIAEPLGIKRYHLPLSPAGEFTLTGGAKFLPRDFMKFGQVHLNGGTWNGSRIFTTDWSRLATSHRIDIGTRKYGYLWWINEYPHKGRNIRAYFAAGNGGQIVMAMPELDLVMAFYAGNYNDAGGLKAQNIYVPKYILPAVDN
jgi:CubicO group peptidase (beta-lactamase class C family)